MNGRVVGAAVGAFILALPVLALAQEPPSISPPVLSNSSPEETAPPDPHPPVPGDALIPPKARDTPVDYPEGAIGREHIAGELGDVFGQDT